MKNDQEADDRRRSELTNSLVDRLVAPFANNPSQIREARSEILVALIDEFHLGQLERECQEAIDDSELIVAMEQAYSKAGFSPAMRDVLVVVRKVRSANVSYDPSPPPDDDN